MEVLPSMGNLALENPGYIYPVIPEPIFIHLFRRSCADFGIFGASYCALFNVMCLSRFLFILFRLPIRESGDFMLRVAAYNDCALIPSHCWFSNVRCVLVRVYSFNISTPDTDLRPPSRFNGQGIRTFSEIRLTRTKDPNRDSTDRE